MTLSKDYIYGIVIVVLVALLTVSVFTNGFGIIPAKGTSGNCNPGTMTGTENTSGTANVSGSTGTADEYAGLQQMPLTVGSLPVQGQASAPVTWIEFSDFECPYCQMLFSQVDSQLIPAYVQTGKVKMYFRNFPLTQIHPNAEAAAEASRCANEQGQFWAMHDKLFTEQGTWAGASASDAQTDFIGYATGLGLNATQFTSCLTAGKYANDIQTDLQDGQSFGVQGTPGVFVMLPKSQTDFTALKNVVSASGGALTLYQDNDSLIVFVGGALPYSEFTQVLNTVTY
jgi:protein-disulfide isomerase